MTRRTGRLYAVGATSVGATLTDDHTAGATSLTVDDAADFNEDGGDLALPDGTVVAYTAADLDDDIITLASPLPSTLVVDDRVRIYPDAPVVTGWVQLDGESELTACVVDHALQSHVALRQGIRGSTDTAVTVEVQQRADGPHIVDVIADPSRVVVYADDVLAGTVNAALEIGSDGRIYAGNPNGARAEIIGDGFVAYNDNEDVIFEARGGSVNVVGSISTRLGTGSGTGPGVVLRNGPASIGEGASHIAWYTGEGPESAPGEIYALEQGGFPSMHILGPHVGDNPQALNRPAFSLAWSPLGRSAMNFRAQDIYVDTFRVLQFGAPTEGIYSSGPWYMDGTDVTPYRALNTDVVATTYGSLNEALGVRGGGTVTVHVDINSNRSIVAGAQSTVLAVLHTPFHPNLAAVSWGGWAGGGIGHMTGLINRDGEIVVRWADAASLGPNIRITANYPL